MRITCQNGMGSKRRNSQPACGGARARPMGLISWEGTRRYRSLAVRKGVRGGMGLKAVFRCCA